MNNTFPVQSGCLSPHKRWAFSLVELLVAMALIIFMLSIMSQAFVIATTAMSGLKNMSDMIDKVRPVMATLERDLNAYHFDGTRRLSQNTFWESGPPQQGYFMVWQDKPNSNHNPLGPTPASTFNNASGGPVYQEGVSNNVGYGLANEDANHTLAFTVRSPERNLAKPDDFFALNVNYTGSGSDFLLTNLRNSLSATPPFALPPPTTPSYLGEDLANFYFPMGTPGPWDLRRNRNLNFGNQNVLNRGFASRRRLEQILCDWMEVAYFIRPTGRVTEGGVPLCTLYRQNRYVLPYAEGLNAVTYYLRDLNFLNTLPYLYNISLFTSNSPTLLPVGGAGGFAHDTWPVKFNTPATLTMPWRRMGVSQTNSNPVFRGLREYNHAGVLGNTNGLDFFVPYHSQSASHPAAYSDVFLDNVISFEVKLQVDNVADYRSLWEIAGAYNPNVPPLNGNPETLYLQSYPGPHSATDPRHGFTKVPSSTSFNNAAAEPFWRRGTYSVAGSNRFYDRVVFDTWNRNNSIANPDSWESRTVGGAVLEQTGAGFMYPKPAVGPADPTFMVQYDNGLDLDVLGQDITGFTGFPTGAVHPSYRRISSPASLSDLLQRHSTGGTNWRPTAPGPSTIPIFSNSYASVTPPVYFPKGPQIYSIQVSIRIYDEKSKSSKEFRLIARL